MRFLIIILLPILCFSQKNNLENMFQKASIEFQICDSLISYCERKTSIRHQAYLSAGWMHCLGPVGIPVALSLLLWPFFLGLAGEKCPYSGLYLNGLFLWTSYFVFF